MCKGMPINLPDGGSAAAADWRIPAASPCRRLHRRLDLRFCIPWLDRSTGAHHRSRAFQITPSVALSLSLFTIQTLSLSLQRRHVRRCSYLCAMLLCTCQIMRSAGDQSIVPPPVYPRPSKDAVSPAISARASSAATHRLFSISRSSVNRPRAPCRPQLPTPCLTHRYAPRAGWVDGAGPLRYFANMFDEHKGANAVASAVSDRVSASQTHLLTGHAVSICRCRPTARPASRASSGRAWTSSSSRGRCVTPTLTWYTIGCHCVVRPGRKLCFDSGLLATVSPCLLTG